MNKICPYWFLVVEAISMDFEEEKITWKELYDRLFLNNTDINNLMIFTLQSLGVNINSEINFKEIENLRNNVIYDWEIVENDGHKFLLVKNTNEKTPIFQDNENQINAALEKLGYFKVS